jgi:hypothetical protein
MKMPKGKNNIKMGTCHTEVRKNVAGNRQELRRMDKLGCQVTYINMEMLKEEAPITFLST